MHSGETFERTRETDRQFMDNQLLQLRNLLDEKYLNVMIYNPDQMCSKALYVLKKNLRKAYKTMLLQYLAKDYTQALIVNHHMCEQIDKLSSDDRKAPFCSGVLGILHMLDFCFEDQLTIMRKTSQDDLFDTLSAEN